MQIQRTWRTNCVYLLTKLSHPSFQTNEPESRMFMCTGNFIRQLQSKTVPRFSWPIPYAILIRTYVHLLPVYLNWITESVSWGLLTPHYYTTYSWWRRFSAWHNLVLQSSPNEMLTCTNQGSRETLWRQNSHCGTVEIILNSLDNCSAFLFRLNQNIVSTVENEPPDSEQNSHTRHGR
jgi:hypothetical protein